VLKKIISSCDEVKMLKCLLFNEKELNVMNSILGRESKKTLLMGERDKETKTHQRIMRDIDMPAEERMEYGPEFVGEIEKIRNRFQEN